MDAILHNERVGRARRQITRPVSAGALPDGVMIRVGGVTGLLINGRLRPWSFRGYAAAAGAGGPGPAELLTPPSIVAAIRAGYRPLVHPTALAGPGRAGGTPPGVRMHVPR